jgi:hypothetical protein
VEEETSQLFMSIDPEPGEDEEQRAWLAGQLREELLQLDVHRVDAVHGGEAPGGTRSGPWTAVGALLVTLAGDSGALAGLIDAVKSWLSRVGGRTAKLELDGDVLELTGVSSRQQQQLIDAWLARQRDADGVPAERGDHEEVG